MGSRGSDETFHYATTFVETKCNNVRTVKFDSIIINK